MTDEERCHAEQTRAAAYLADCPQGPESRGARLGLADWMMEEVLAMDHENNMRMLAAGLSASLVGPIEEWLSSRFTTTTRSFCTHCKAIVATEEEAIAHDGACLKHPMAERALKAEAMIEEMLKAEEGRHGLLSDTLQQIAEAEARIAELTANEEPRKAAERIALDFMVTGVGIREMLVNSITTAIQAASNAQLERGRARISELREELSKVAGHWRKALDERITLDHWNHVYNFMEKFQQHIGDAPGWPPQEVLDLRIQLMAEEFCEMLDAAGYPYILQIGERGISYFEGWERGDVTIFRDYTSHSVRPDFPAFIRELLDLEVTVLGTHIACGIDPAEPWARVVAANMAKDLVAGQPVKPEGWQAPDIAGALREQGWQGGAE